MKKIFSILVLCVLNINAFACGGETYSPKNELFQFVESASISNDSVKSCEVLNLKFKPVVQNGEMYVRSVSLSVHGENKKHHEISAYENISQTSEHGGILRYCISKKYLSHAELTFYLGVTSKITPGPNGIDNVEASDFGCIISKKFKLTSVL